MGINTRYDQAAELTTAAIDQNLELLLHARHAAIKFKPRRSRKAGKQSKVRG